MPKGDNVPFFYRFFYLEASLNLNVFFFKVTIKNVGQGTKINACAVRTAMRAIVATTAFVATADMTH